MTDYAKLANAELLDWVERAGRALPPELIRVLLARRIDLRNMILERFAEAINDDWDDADDPRWYRAVHYGYLLIAYRERKALPIFAAVYSDADSYDALLEWFEEAPANFGPPAVPIFQAVIEEVSGVDWDFGAALSVSILGDIAIRFPETRLAVVTFLRSLLPALDANGRVVLGDEEEIDDLWGSIVDALAELHDRESMAHVLAMFDAELIDPMEIDLDSYLDVLEGRQSTEKTQIFDIFATYADVARRDQGQAAHKQ
jgi:hypothetical protein